jgi:hypothetical protein
MSLTRRGLLGAAADQARQRADPARPLVHA